MREFYSREETQKQKEKLRHWEIIAACVGLLGLTACVLLCMRVNTLNARKTLFEVIGLSTVSGWIVILLYQLSIAPTKADIRHSEGILRGQSEFLTGEMRRETAVFHIPHSITVRGIRLITQENTCALNISEKYATDLPADGTIVRVRAVNRYIAGCEVCHDED